MNRTKSESLSKHSVLVADNVGYSFAGRSILSEVNLDITAGEVVAFTGPSGVGKSTLLYLLSGLIAPQIGSVLWNGHNPWSVREPKFTALRATFCSYVFQFPVFLQECTVLENALLPAKLTKKPLTKFRERARDLLDEMGMAAMVSRLPHTLSGGELQRLSVVRALLLEPAVVFADEPTGSLDETTSTLVFDLICDISKKCNASLVVVTHDLSLAKLADRHIVLRNGRLDEIC